MATASTSLTYTIGGESLTRAQYVFVIEYLKDGNQRRAAKLAGRYSPEAVEEVFNCEPVQRAIQAAILKRGEIAQIDSAFLQREFLENHYLARYDGKWNASNQALMMIGKLNTVDAFAAEKVQLSSAGDVVARLQRARARKKPTDVPSFL